MSTFREYQQRRPANPEAVAHYKAEIMQELQREQLAKLIFITDNKNIPTNTLETDWDTGNPEIEDYAYNIADTIIQAGWTPPPTRQREPYATNHPTYLDN